MRSLFRSILLLACWPLAAQSAAAANGADSNPVLSYVHLYVDAKGDSHFREEQFDFRSTRAGGPLMHALSTGAGAMLLRLKPGAVEDWHNAPKPWYLIVVQGMSEVTASDGEVRRFGPDPWSSWTIPLAKDTARARWVTSIILQP